MLINTHSSALHHVLVLGLVYHNHTSDLWGNLGVLKKIELKIESFCEIFLKFSQFSQFYEFLLLIIWYEIIILDEILEVHSTKRISEGH